MLSYCSQSSIFKYLKFEKRFNGYFHLKIENHDTWIFPEPGNLKIACIGHEKTAIIKAGTRRVNCHVAELSVRVLKFYLGRKGTIIGNFYVKGNIQIPFSIFQPRIFNLQVCSDDRIATWFHAIRGNRLRHVAIVGRAAFDLLETSEILNSERVTIVPSSENIQNLALAKMTRNKYLRFEFNDFLRNYYRLSEEILEISRQNRPIGSIIDYYVHDPFNRRIYPNFARIVMDLKAKLKKIGEISAISIPTANGAELNVYIAPEDKIKKTWILRMAVMKKIQ
ncbi:hypothetical protein B9Z55_008078 [Caenorhabditis nigoni]|uniref:Uncharacterized protein n=1 Tax=Caenorhabditis nigoni TaxID=1611254 RepID=A0A2G5VCI7_9PELO|nr:hypothetical protein B9Z55_008078 [Caenorhabditis nigoni]